MTHPRTDASLLIVDDEPANVLPLERILERAGFYLSVNVSADTATSPRLLAAVHEVPARRLVLDRAEPGGRLRAGVPSGAPSRAADGSHAVELLSGGPSPGPVRVGRVHVGGRSA
jgi:CheY-like chemotaxis protein